MDSIVFKQVGAQLPTKTGTTKAQAWKPADENELALVQLVLAYPLAVASIYNAAHPLTRNHFQDSMLGAVYGVCCHLLQEKQAVTLAAILSTLNEWSNDPDAVTFDDAEKATANLPSLAATKPSVDKRTAILELRRLAGLIHRRNELTARRTDGIYRHTTGADLAGRIGATQWLWPSYIPNGYMTLLVADQDQGKSTVALDFCRTVLQGERWPDGKPNTPRPDAKLLWIDTEGALALWYERALAWRVPVENFIFPEDALQELRIDDVASWDWIESTIDIFAPPLVIVDSLSGAHSGKENDTDEMKAVCKKLSSLAARTGVAMVVIHHLNKASGGIPDYPVNLARARGASSITQFCRSVLALGTPDKSQPDARRLDSIKMNLSRKPAAVGYELTDDGPAWGEAPEPYSAPRPIDDAKEALQEALKDGPRPSDDVQEELKQTGVSYRAFKDAKKALGVIVRRAKIGDGAKWYICLTKEDAKALHAQED